MSDLKIIKLNYDNKEKSMYFVPKRFNDLLNYFKEEFKAFSGKYKFYFKDNNLDNNEEIIEDNISTFENQINKIMKLNVPIIYVQNSSNSQNGSLDDFNNFSSINNIANSVFPGNSYTIEKSNNGSLEMDNPYLKDKENELKDAKIKELELKIKNLEEDNHKLKKNLEDTKQLNKAKIEQIKKLEKELNDNKKGGCSVCRERFGDKEKIIKDLKDKNKSLENENQDLFNENLNLKSIKSKLEEEKNKLEEKLNKMSDNEELKNQIEKLIKENKDKESEIQSLKYEVEQLQNPRPLMEDDYDNGKERIKEELKYKMKDFVDKINAINDNYRKEVEEKMEKYIKINNNKNENNNNKNDNNKNEDIKSLINNELIKMLKEKYNSFIENYLNEERRKLNENIENKMNYIIDLYNKLLTN